MLTKPLKITLTAGQAAVFKVVVEQLVAVPAAGGNHAPAWLERMVLAEWYRKNAGRFVLLPEALRLSFMPSQAYALNALLKAQPMSCEAATSVARMLIAAIDPKV